MLGIILLFKCKSVYSIIVLCANLATSHDFHVKAISKLLMYMHMYD